MKRSVLWGLVPLVLACGDGPNATLPTSEVVQEEVLEFLASYRAALDQRDSVSLPTFYVDDDRFEWIEDGRVQYQSPDEVLAALAGIPSDMSFRTEYPSTDVVAVGRNAARASMEFETTVGDGPSAYTFGGMISVVLEREGATWRIVTGHSSTTRPDSR